MESVCKNRKEHGAGRDAKGRWQAGQSGNAAGRPMGASCAALRAARDAALEVALPLLIEKAKGGDTDAARVLVQVGLPRLKPIALPIQVDLPKTQDFSELLRAVLNAVAVGRLSVDDAQGIASIVATAARCEDVAALQERCAILSRHLAEMENRPLISVDVSKMSIEELNAMARRILEARKTGLPMIDISKFSPTQLEALRIELDHDEEQAQAAADVNIDFSGMT